MGLFRIYVNGDPTNAVLPGASANIAAYFATVSPGDKVYQGMIVGENSRNNDLEINILKAKQLTNMRASGKDDNILLTPPRKMSMEDMMSYINDDELVEVTPQSLRLRKKLL